MDRLQADIKTRFIKNEESDIYEFIISDASLDRHNTIIPIDAWNLENYSKNPIVLYMHQSGAFGEVNPDYVIGIGEVEKEGDKLIGRVILEPAEINPLAEKVAKKIEFGSLNTTSVGFLPISGHWGNEARAENPDIYYFDEVELLEFSIVNIPSNPNAVKRYSEFISKQKPVKEKEFNTLEYKVKLYSNMADAAIAVK